MKTTPAQSRFESWLAAVRQAASSLGFELDDLPDCPFADWYEAGDRPAQAARRALRNARGLDTD